MTGDGDEAGFVENPIGIVDPFLKVMVRRGDRFWLYLYPRTITGLRHSWTHPALPDDGLGAVATGNHNPPANKALSEAWLRDFISTADCPSYEEVMEMAERIARGDNPAFDDDYMHFDGRDAHGDIPPEFWDHVSVVLGKSVANRPKYFSCQC